MGRSGGSLSGHSRKETLAQKKHNVAQGETNSQRERARKRGGMGNWSSQKGRLKCRVARPAGNEVSGLREMRMGKAAVGLQSSVRPQRTYSTNTVLLMS